jgi:hypothetical protein
MMKPIVGWMAVTLAREEIDAELALTEGVDGDEKASLSIDEAQAPNFQ